MYTALALCVGGRKAISSLVVDFSDQAGGQYSRRVAPTFDGLFEFELFLNPVKLRHIDDGGMKAFIDVGLVADLTNIDWVG